MSTRTVNFTLLKPDGTPWVHSVRFELVPGSYDASAQQPVRVVRATPDSTGAGSVELWPNEDGVTSSRYLVTLPDNDQFYITVPTSPGPFSLSALREASATDDTEQFTTLLTVLPFLSAKARGAQGDGTTDDYTVLSAAADSLDDADGGTLAFGPGTYKVGTDWTVPASVGLLLLPGAVLQPASGVTITINGPLNAGLFQVFDVSAGGSIVLGGRFVSVHTEWWGAVGDGTTDDTAAIQEAVDTLIVAGAGDVRLAAPSYRITATITATAGIRFIGSGSNGTELLNEDNDVEAIKFVGTSNSAARGRVEGMSIVHHAATKYAVVFSEASHSIMEDVFIKCETEGFGGVLYGDETSPPSIAAYFGTMRNCRVQHYTSVGVRVNSTGTQWHFIDCHVASSVNGAHGAYINKQGVKITRGEWAAPNTGGIGIYCYNNGAADLPGPSIEGVIFEGTAAGEYSIVLDGNTRAWVGGVVRECETNLAANAGTFIKFGRAKHCVAKDIKFDNATSGGYACEWGQNSDSCVLEVHKDAATAPVTVHASATRAQKIVTNVVARSAVSAITTASNLRTVLRAGVDELPGGFVPTHNGVGWNYLLQALSDDAAVSVTPPAPIGVARVWNDDEISTFGLVAYDTAVPSVEILAGGSNFEVTTGALAGNTGTDGKVTVSAHSGDGKFYVEARKGASKITLLFDSVLYT